ncbi:MAG TPA: hypothetical protein VJ249_09730 [Candidatus Bathyarchaeia archaeon]|nr:hypothetical protein [Candidatus Bathyarchaeia archaeon]
MLTVNAVTFERIPPSPDDRTFREIVKKTIDSARTEIIVAAGELGSYGFSELRQAAHEALARGVRVRVYASAAPPDFVDELRQRGAEVYIGETRIKDHYMVVDRETLIVSEKAEVGKPTESGTREARVYKNNPAVSREIREFFENLLRSDFMKRARKESKIGAFADAVFEAFVPSYGKPAKEPRIDA